MIIDIAKYCVISICIVKRPKYDGYQKGISSMIYNLFDRTFMLQVQINLLVVVLKMKICKIKSSLKNYTKELLKTFKKGKYIDLL